MVGRYLWRAKIKWAKKSSPRFEIGKGQYEYHWYEHPGIGCVEIKLKQVAGT
jgi:hypothetical protein